MGCFGLPGKSLLPQLCPVSTPSTIPLLRAPVLPSVSVQVLPEADAETGFERSEGQVRAQE